MAKRGEIFLSTMNAALKLRAYIGNVPSLELEQITERMNQIPVTEMPRKWQREIVEEIKGQFWAEHARREYEDDELRKRGEEED
jgi:hypothetical protein